MSVPMASQVLRTAARKAMDEREPQDRLQAIRHVFLDRLWLGGFVVALIATPISALRAYATDWYPVYCLHVAIGLSVALFFFARHAISYRVKLYVLIALFALIGISGIFSLGLIGSGVWFLVMCGFLASTFFPLRVGVTVAIATSLILVVAAFLFTYGILKIPFDANEYAASGHAWIALWLSTSIMPFVVFSAFATYQKTIVDLLHEVQQQRDQITELAGRDHLTGLPLADLANDRLQMLINSARRDQSRVAFMFVDLNGFKGVNDTWGHEAGDQLLQAIATRLTNSVRTGDTVGRIGGDEFVLLLGNLKSRQESIAIAEKVIANVCQPVAYAGQSILPGVSIGIAIYPEDAGDIATLRRLADRAMYRAKRRGENGFAFIDETQLVG